MELHRVAQRPLGYQQLSHSKHKDKMPTEPYLQYLVRLFNDVTVYNNFWWNLMLAQRGQGPLHCFKHAGQISTKNRDPTHWLYTPEKQHILNFKFWIWCATKLYIYIFILYRLKTYFHLTGDPLSSQHLQLFDDHTKRVVNFRRGRISRDQVKIRHAYLTGSQAPPVR